ncbi:MAG TPA: hypothetical protein VK427_11955 [Kofleriaceae bacterium]|nr:hypothetical protein [Kofleriaceae bacterium]
MSERERDDKPQQEQRPEAPERNAPKPAEPTKLRTDTLDDNPLILRGMD